MVQRERRKQRRDGKDPSKSVSAYTGHISVVYGYRPPRAAYIISREWQRGRAFRLPCYIQPLRIKASSLCMSKALASGPKFGCVTSRDKLQIPSLKWLVTKDFQNPYGQLNPREGRLCNSTLSSLFMTTHSFCMLDTF